MYLGRYYHRLESKGRVSLPAKFRAALGDGAIITKELDHCLSIFDKDAWEKKVETIKDLEFTKQANRNYIRFLTNDAGELEVDGQGRIRIESDLLLRANIKKEVVFVGTNDHIEIWDKETYHTYIDTIEQHIEEQVETITNGTDTHTSTT